ncbi:glycoside hydrolase family 3 N-terminal domain-containing protein [Pseudoduganella sp. UC29_106]|uniref:glycoside hydrolase family 3 N-terminal domain-containing protein n=1 Tax=Pseudoduganella sp. UC29_106 TaxID=3374553 RepID=UPI00375671F6
MKKLSLALAVTLALPAVATPAAPIKDWPHIQSAIKRDEALEKRVQEIVGKMTLEQKIGQMTQPEIKTAKPEDVKRYYLGSVLNGGGSWPNGNKHASAKDWLDLAEAYHQASMSTDMAVKVPVIWGIDAIHRQQQCLRRHAVSAQYRPGCGARSEAGGGNRPGNRQGGTGHRHRLGLRSDHRGGAR